MYLNKWGMRLALAALIFLGALACRTADVFVAQATVTPTRTPRPTFTPLPKVTDTPVPTIPPPPTTAPPTPVPSRTPTRRPPTARPPTAVPPPVVQPTAPPAPVSRMAYGVNAAYCSHSGSSYIKGKVYDGTNPDSGGVAGIKVAIGGADGSGAWEVVSSFDDGVYSFTLTADGGGAKVGTFYIWLRDNNGNRISDIGGPIVINGLGPDAPGSCWAGGADFWRR